MKKSFKEILVEVRERTYNFDPSTSRRFEVQHLSAARNFIESLDEDSNGKVKFVVDEATRRRDPKILKDDVRRLMLTTHGFIKKTDKVPLKELEKANKIRSQYFTSKA